MSCDVGEATEGLENELWCRWSNGKLGEWALLLLFQAFSHFTYITAHSPMLPSLYLHHSSFSNPSVVSPSSQLILQPFFHFSYVTGFSLTSPGELPMVHKVSFHGDVYRNKTQLKGKIYWNRDSKCWAIFQHIHLRNRDIYHTMAPNFLSLYHRNLPPGIETTSYLKSSCKLIFVIYEFYE